MSQFTFKCDEARRGRGITLVTQRTRRLQLAGMPREHTRCQKSGGFRNHLQAAAPSPLCKH